jgi:transposase-like protein
MKQKYTVATKLKIVQEARDTSISATSTKYNVDRKSIREWMAQEDKLTLRDQTAYRLQGGGRRPLDSALEEMLIERIRDTRIEKLRVSRSMITNWAIEMSDDRQTPTTT